MSECPDCGKEIEFNWDMLGTNFCCPECKTMLMWGYEESWDGKEERIQTWLEKVME